MVVTEPGPQAGTGTHSQFVWLWLVVNDRKFLAETVFFSHTNQAAVLLHEPAIIRTSQSNKLDMRSDGLVTRRPLHETWAP